MTGIQLATLAGLWIVLAALAGLVLVLYRQVDKAYALGGLEDSDPLPAGTAAPPLEVIRHDGSDALLEPPSQNSPYAVVFLLPSCSSCIQLVKSIRSDPELVENTIGLLSGETTGEFALERVSPLRMYSLAHPPDALGPYSVSRTPMAYVLFDGTILGGRYVGSSDELRSLMEEASRATRTPAASVDG